MESIKTNLKKIGSDSYEATMTLSGDKKTKRMDLVRAYYNALTSIKLAATGDCDTALLCVSYAISENGKDVVITVTWDATTAGADPDSGIFEASEALLGIMEDKKVKNLLIDNEPNETKGKKKKVKKGPGNKTDPEKKSPEEDDDGDDDEENDGDEEDGDEEDDDEEEENDGKENDGKAKNKGKKPGIAFKAFQNAFSGDDGLWDAFQKGYNMAGGKSKP